MILSINMGVSLVPTSANITEMSYMSILKITVSAMFGFRHFIGQCWSCMHSCVLNELLYFILIAKKFFGIKFNL